VGVRRAPREVVGHVVRRPPAGAAGGDGEYAREALAFGLLTERPGVYRVWGRAWLVEK